MDRTKYTLSFDKAKKSERIVRKHLLDNSDRVRLAIVPEFFVIGKNIQRYKFKQSENPKFIALLDRLKNEFIRKTSKTQRAFGFKTHYGYYSFKLSQKLKNLINKDTLITSGINFKSYNLLGFEDPVFYSKKLITGKVISHEPIIILYLTRPEKLELEKQHVEFD